MFKRGLCLGGGKPVQSVQKMCTNPDLFLCLFISNFFKHMIDTFYKPFILNYSVAKQPVVYWLYTISTPPTIIKTILKIFNSYKEA